MVAAIASGVAAMLREPLPQRGARTVFEGVGAYTDDAVPVPERLRDSPGSKKKYTPRCGQSMRPLHSASWRQPPTPAAKPDSNS